MMFNPFLPFISAYIDVFSGRGYQYLVAQTFPCDEAQQLGKQGLLLTPYSDHGLALIHRKARSTDPLACILDLQKEAHRKKVNELLGALSGYSVWAGIVSKRTEVEDRLRNRYKTNVRRYIMNHTNWRIKGDSSFNVNMELVFGEVYIHLKYNSYESIKEKLEVIATN